MTALTSPKINTIGIIGYGHFGQFLAELISRFAPEVTIKVSTRSQEPDGRAFFDLEEVCQCDAVILACPISAYEEMLEKIVPLIPVSSVIVDVATVKKHTTDILKKLAPEHLYLATHPMFGPESYQKSNHDVSGYRIVITDSTLPAGAYNALKDWLTKLGFLVIELSAEEHDKLLAETLFMTHYIGQTMQVGDFGRTSVDTVSFSSLMDAVEAVAHDGQLFRDVYNYNPYCEAMAVRFHEAQQVVLEGLLRHRE